MSRLFADVPRVLFFVLVFASFSVLGEAKDVDVTKVVTWTFEEQPGANEAGTFTWNFADTVAKDNHIDVKPAGGVATEGNGAWIVNNGLPSVTKTTTLLGGDGEPEAESKATFEANAPAAIGELFQVVGSVRAEAASATVDENPGNHLKQTARAKVNKTKMTIAAGTVTGVVIKQPGKKIRVGSIARYLKGDGIGALSGRGTWKDPVVAVVREVETGATIREPIFDLEAEGIAAGEWTWDESVGIVLDVPVDGVSSARISGGFVSSWISSSPGLFSIRLADGAFETTGALDGLPWVLTFSGSDVVRAELSPGNVPLMEAEYALPASLVVDTNNYEQSLEIESSADVRVGVPEVPAFSRRGVVALVLLIGSGIWILGLYRR